MARSSWTQAQITEYLNSGVNELQVQALIYQLISESFYITVDTYDDMLPLCVGDVAVMFCVEADTQNSQGQKALYMYIPGFADTPLQMMVFITGFNDRSLSSLTAANKVNSIDNTDFPQTWDWSTFDGVDGFNAMVFKADNLRSAIGGRVMLIQSIDPVGGEHHAKEGLVINVGGLNTGQALATTRGIFVINNHTHSVSTNNIAVEGRVTGSTNAAGLITNFGGKFHGVNNAGLLIGDLNSSYGAIWPQYIVPLLCSAINYAFASFGTTVASVDTVNTKVNGTEVSLRILDVPILVVLVAGVTITGALTVNSTTAGFLPPRMTTGQRDAIATPAEGLQIYNTTTKKINFYNGTAWEAVTSA